MFTRAARARHGDARSVAGGQDVDVVVALGAVDDDGVGLAVVAACGASEVHVDRGKLGPAQVVDGDRVGAPQGVEVDRLDADEVHRDATDVAGEPTWSTFAEMATFSEVSEPSKTSVSVPSSPKTESLPSPGSHWNTSLPC